MSGVLKKLAGGLLALTVLTAPAAAQDRPDLVVAVDSLYRTLEPINGNSTPSNRMFPNFFNALVGRNFADDPEGGELVPELAVSWEQPSPNVWRLTLREGVKFHNGAEMTAEDVAFSLSAQRIWGEGALVPAGTRYTEGITRVEAMAPYVVEIETANPDPNLLYRFVTPLGYIVPKEAYLAAGPDAFGQNPIGTGPYRVTKFDATERVELEAFDDYWGGQPPAAHVTFLVVPEFSARLAGMVSGEFDMMVNVPTDQVEAVEGYDQLNYIGQPLSNYVLLAYNTLDLPQFGPNPLTDVNLRYAMTSAVDLGMLTEALWGDVTFAPAPFNFPEFVDYYDAAITPKYGYDPAAARAFLDASSYNGEEIVLNLTRGAFSNFDLAVQYLVEQWQALGINVRINTLESWPLALQHPFGLLNMSMDAEFDGTPTRAIWGFWGPDSARATREADRSWAPPEAFVETGRAYLAATDIEQKRTLFRQMVEIWEDAMPALMVWRNVANWVVRDGLEVTPTSGVRILLGPNYLKIDG